MPKLDWEYLDYELTDHPDQSFRHSVVRVAKSGHIYGMNHHPKHTKNLPKNVKNLLSAYLFMPQLDQILTKELKQGWIFCNDNFPIKSQIRLGTVPKSGNRRRMIRHGSWPYWPGVSVNSLIPKYCAGTILPSFTKICMLAQKIGRFGFMGRDDLVSAYRQTGTNPAEWPYHTYKHRGRILIDTRTADGIRSSGPPCQQLGVALIYIANKHLPLKYRGYILNYLDDFIYGYRNRTGAIKIRNALRNVMNKAKVDWSVDKAVKPSQKIIVIGYEFDFNKFIVKMSDDRLNSWKSQINDILSSQHKTYHEIESFIGKLEFGSPVIWPLRSYVSALRKALPKNRDPNLMIPINDNIKYQLGMWLKYMSLLNGMDLNLIGERPETALPIYCDASDNGFGIFSEPHWMYGAWNQLESTQHINWQELYTVLIAIHNLVPKIKGKNILIICDNTTAVNILKKIYSPVTELMDIVTEICNICINNQIKYYVTDITSKNNKFADYLSRFQINKFKNQCKLTKTIYNEESLNWVSPNLLIKGDIDSNITNTPDELLKVIQSIFNEK